MSIHRFIGPNNKLDTNYSIVEGAIKPSKAIKKLPSNPKRNGNGAIILDGAYTGVNDASIKFKIVSVDGPSGSLPEYVGIGNHELNVVSIDAGTQEQVFTITLAASKSPAEYAKVEIGGYEILAKEVGTTGNSITIQVDASGLVFTDTKYSLINDLSVGSSELKGTQYDWESVPIANNSVPVDAKRIKIGDYSIIYRNWKEFKNNDWYFTLSPETDRAYKKGSKIQVVTGTYTVTVTKGNTVETYTNIITLKDFLTALSESTLLTVPTLPKNNFNTDNTAAILDLQARTSARIVSAEGLEDVFISDNAPTETVNIKCIEPNTSERVWKVTGSVSGSLTDAKEGIKYNNGLLWGFTIPRKIPDNIEYANEKTKFLYTPVERQDEEVLPEVCFDEIKAGVDLAKAFNNANTMNFKYTKRPNVSINCACTDTDWIRLPININTALGVTTTDGGNDMALNANYAERLTDISTWITDKSSYNIHGDKKDSLNPLYTSNNLFMDTSFLSETASVFIGALRQSYEVADALTEWDTKWGEAKDALNWLYASVGKKVQPIPHLINAPFGTKTTPPSAGYVETYTIGDLSITPNSLYPNENNDGRLYKFSNSIYTGDVFNLMENLPTVFNQSIKLNGNNLGTIYIQLAYVYWSPQTDYIVGDVTVRTSNGKVWRCTTAGTSDTTCPDFLEGTSPITDGTAVWTAIDLINGTLNGLMYYDDVKDVYIGCRSINSNLTRSGYIDLFKSQMNNVLILAGIDPFDLASINDDTSKYWQDEGKEYWWVHQSTNLDFKLKPVFTNKQYITVTEDGELIKGLSFVVKVACEESLKEGDLFYIVANYDYSDNTYKAGDTFTIDMIAASPLQLCAGKDIDNTEKWNVSSSLGGSLPTYVKPGIYNNNGIQFEIINGNIPSVVGDKIIWAVQRKGFKYKIDNNEWSNSYLFSDNVDINGLVPVFTAGKHPSWVTDDSYEFWVMQPYKLANISLPDRSNFAWSGNSIKIAFDTTVATDLIIIALHTIPLDATVSLDYFDADLQDLVTVSCTPVKGPIVCKIDTTATEFYLTISHPNQDGGAIGWLWAGPNTVGDFTTQGNALNAIVQTRSLDFNMVKGSGINPIAYTRGRGTAFKLQFGTVLAENDLDLFYDLLEWTKVNNDIPFCFIPNIDNSLINEAYLVRMPDNLTPKEWLNYWNVNRNYSLDMELTPWIA